MEIKCRASPELKDHGGRAKGQLKNKFGQGCNPTLSCRYFEENIREGGSRRGLFREWEVKSPSVLLPNDLAECLGSIIEARRREGPRRQSPTPMALSKMSICRLSGARGVEAVSVVLLAQPKEEVQFQDRVV
jgi:hypothetical protein